jgi:hypothetical protein
MHDKKIERINTKCLVKTKKTPTGNFYLLREVYGEDVRVTALSQNFRRMLRGPESMY